MCSRLVGACIKLELLFEVVMSRVTGLWSWDFFKESSDHAMLFLLIMAEGSGVPECCIIVILIYLLVLMILLLGV
ncbi:hypothetical protein IMY05_006G0203900 [Salix suchowensis]|nr:hypothetical protein IMY05_006G0203900 [Salix suchowensis]